MYAKDFTLKLQLIKYTFRIILYSYGNFYILEIPSLQLYCETTVNHLQASATNFTRLELMGA